MPKVEATPSSGLRQALIGSTGSDLLKTLTIDTLVIHPEHESAA